MTGSQGKVRGCPWAENRLDETGKTGGRFLFEGLLCYALGRDVSLPIVRSLKKPERTGKRKISSPRMIKQVVLRNLFKELN